MKKKRHLPCWKRKRWNRKKEHALCRHYSDCCICSGWHDEGHRS